MAHTFNEEWQEMISAQILAAKSFYDPGNSATSPKLYSDPTILCSLSKTKLGLQLSLEHSNLLSQVSNISPENGEETVKKNDYWELVSPELWITP
tara:strand:- start:510 stop:794 length:285 start_codon:yes stop_codon:yes gene_type:complete